MQQAQRKCLQELSNNPYLESAPTVKRIKRTTTRKVNTFRKTIITAGVVLFAYSFLLVFLCIKSASLGYQINSLENDIKKLENANRAIEYQIARKTSLENVEKVAVNDLGMIKPDMNTAVIVATPSKPVEVAVQDSRGAAQSTAHSPLRHLYQNIYKLARSN